MNIREAQIYLNESRNNIDRIRELSALSGVSYCCLGSLEKRQAELEYLFYGNRNLRGALRGNLGVLPVFLGWGVVIGITTIASAISAVLYQRAKTAEARYNAEANLVRAQTEQSIVNKGLNPNDFLPPPAPKPLVEKSAMDKIVDVIQLAVIIGGIGLAFGIFKGFGKKT